MKKWIKMAGMGMLILGLSFIFKNQADAAQITNVKQTEGSLQSVKIQWDADINATKYVYTVTDGTVSQPFETTIANASIYNLSPGKSYTVTVAGYRGNQIVSEASVPVTVVTAPNTDNFSAVQTDATTSSISVEASGAVGADYYFIMVDNNLLASGTSPSLTVSGLTANSKYDLHVFAARRSESGFVAFGAYSYKGIYSARTLGNALKKSEFGISAAYLNINTYYFSVIGANNASGYQIQFKNMKGKTKKTVTSSGMASTSIAGFINGHFYKYRIRSFVDCNGKKVYSKWSVYRYVGLIKKISGKIKNGSIVFRWGKVSDAKKYVVYASNSEKSGYKKIKTLKASKRKITVSKVNGKKIKRGSTYYFRIITYSKDGKKAVKSSVYNTFYDRVF